MNVWMAPRRAAAWVLVGAALGLSACGSEEVTPDDAGVSDVEPDAGADGTGQDDVVVDPVTLLPFSCSEADPCSGSRQCRSGVCVTDPPAASKTSITDPVGDKPTTQAPNLTCVGEAPGTPEGPATATLYGAVARFGSGDKTHGMQVDVFLADSYDPSVCEKEASDQAKRTCYDTYGTPIGTAVSVVAEPASVPDSCDANGHADCPLGFRCIKGDLGKECLEQYGVFEIPNVPTNTMLVIRAKAPAATASVWHTTWAFNVYLYADEVGEDGRAHYDATIVSHGQWLNTPNTVGLPEIPETRGVVGGRIRDCRVDGERHSWTIAEASLGLANPPKKLVYFNNLEDNTVPLEGRVTTNILGRFAALDVPVGWNLLSGSVRIGEEVVSVGSARVYVFPYGLSVVSTPGLSPHWSQE